MQNNDRLYLILQYLNIQKEKKLKVVITGAPIKKELDRINKIISMINIMAIPYMKPLKRPIKNLLNLPLKPNALNEIRLFICRYIKQVITPLIKVA